VAHLAQTAPAPPTWESVQQCLPSAAPAPRPRRGPVITVAAIIIVAVIGAVTVLATADKKQRIDVTAGTTLVPATASPPASNTPAGDPPQAIITTGSLTLTVPSWNYCWKGDGVARCASGPLDPQTLRLRGGDRFTVQFTTTEPFIELTATLVQGLHPSFLYLEVDKDGSITIPPNTPAGSYKFIIHGAWSQGNNASYQLTAEVAS